MNKLMFAVCLFLSSCASAPVMTQLQKIELGCASASTALKALSVANKAGKLSEVQVAKITTAGRYLAPICTSKDAPSLNFLQEAAFDEAVKVVVAEGGRYGQ